MADPDPQVAGLLASVDRDRFEQDQEEDMGHVRCRRSATDPSWRQSLEQQERQLEGFHGQHHRGWGELGRHRNKKIVFVTHNGMARLLVDEYGTHVLEPPPPPGAAAPPPSDGVGSAGRLLPRGLLPAEAGKRPIVFEPEWQPVIHPVTVCEALFGEAAARRLRAIMLSANFQHCNIQVRTHWKKKHGWGGLCLCACLSASFCWLTHTQPPFHLHPKQFHQDQAVEGDGHGSRIATLCLRRPAVIQLHSYTTHLTYAFRVEPGDMWGMAGPVLYERSAEGETAWTWAHGVDMAEGRVPGEHHAECRECRISLNYRYLEEGSDQPALTRRALAAKGVVVLGVAGGAGAVAKEEEKDGGGGGGGKRTRTR